MLINKWSGNETTALSISVESLWALIEFCRGHKDVYVFGSGKIGIAARHYLEQSDIAVAGFVTSDSVNEFKHDYTLEQSGIVIGISDGHLSEVMPMLTAFVSPGDIFTLPSEIREKLGNQLSPEFVRDNFWVNIFVTNRCNLFCKSCSTFAPITPLCKANTDYGPDEFKRDIQRLRDLRLPRVTCLKFTGGEPFLHPALLEMFAAAREYFPQTPFECYTNGLIVSGMSEDELLALKDLEVTLTITEYPVKGLDLRGFYERADNVGLNYNVIFSEKRKLFSKRPLDLTKSVPPYCFVDCPRYDFCTSLFMYRGRLWKCIYAFNSVLFNEAFSANLRLTERDSLDLESAAPDRIYRFAVSRIPFCGYCKPITETFEWGISERKLDEWT
jgi:hypothetical protein